MSTVCPVCGTPFEPQIWHNLKTQRFCSRRCNGVALARGRLTSFEHWEDEPSPAEWDSTTQYSHVPDLIHDYRLVCLTCGRDCWLHLTERQARRLVNLPLCQTCHSWQFLEQDFGARTSAPVYSAGEHGTEDHDRGAAA